MQASPDPVLYNTGRLILPLSTLLLFYASLAFPTGRIERRGERRVMWGVTVAMVAAWAIEAMTASNLPVFSIVSRCEGTCPPNPFDVLGPSGGWTLGAFAAEAASAWAIVVALGLRLDRSTPVQRLMLGGVVALMAALAVAISAATILHAAGDDDAAVQVGWAYAPIFVAIPLVFLAGQLRGRMFAGAALRRVLASLGPNPSAARLEHGMRQALGDPSLRIAFPLPAGGHHDAEGHRIDVPATPGLGVAMLRDADGEVATIVHDPALDDIPGLMDAAGAAALLALRHARLSAELRGSIRDLRSSRARVAAAVDDARRRLERELATGAERQLAAVHDELAAAEARASDPHLRAVLAGLVEEAGQVLESVRSTAHGIYPPLLASDGIAAALTSELAGARQPVLVRADDVPRRSQDVEAAIYFACLEAVQNAVKHAGPDAVVTIALRSWTARSSSRWGTPARVSIPRRQAGGRPDEHPRPGRGGRRDRPDQVRPGHRDHRRRRRPLGDSFPGGPRDVGADAPSGALRGGLGVAAERGDRVAQAVERAVAYAVSVLGAAHAQPQPGAPEPQPQRRPGAAGRAVPERLQRVVAAEEEGGLHLGTAAAELTEIQRGPVRAAAPCGAQRGPEPLVGEQRRVEAVGDVADRVDRLLDVVAEAVEEQPDLLRVLARLARRRGRGACAA